MTDRPQVEIPPATSPAPESLLRYLTPCDPTALCRLKRAFDGARPMSMLIGNSTTRSARVLDAFLAGLDDGIDVVRVSGREKDATACMHEVIRLIGFDPKDLSLNDLENILSMFLSFQKTHGRRTVFCLENAEQCNSWVFYKICELVEMEAREAAGLFIVLAGSSELNDALYRAPLEAIAEHAGRPIRVATLSPDETREFVRQRLEFESAEDPREIIDFDAITELHRISSGIPGRVNDLCILSLALARKESVYPITADLVSRAVDTKPADAQNPAGVTGEVDEDEDTVELCVESFTADSKEPPPLDRLVVRLKGAAHSEYRIEGDSLAIGRGPQNDVCIASLKVSRNHAAIVVKPTGVKIMDLGSTNGTFVNGLPVEARVLRHGDRITLGDCQIEYLKADGGLSAATVTPIGKGVDLREARQRERRTDADAARTDARADLSLAGGSPVGDSALAEQGRPQSRDVLT